MSAPTAAPPAVHAPLVPAALPAGLAGLTILAQISYPLLAGRALVLVTITVVVLFAAGTLTHVAHALGSRAALLLLAVAGGGGLASELVGVATGFPFGHYSYAGTLGVSVAGVPLVIGLAWTMMAWPALLLGRRLAGPAAGSGPWARWRRPLAVTVYGGLALASWDLFLDPQMTAAGHWSFDDPAPGLPHLDAIPLTNYAGWLLVSLLVLAAVHALLPDPARLPGPTQQPSEIVPALLLGWTWIGSTVANAAFFDRPWVALYGGIGMGLLVGPYLVKLLTANAPRASAS